MRRPNRTNRSDFSKVPVLTGLYYWGRLSLAWQAIALYKEPFVNPGGQAAAPEKIDYLGCRRHSLEIKLQPPHYLGA